MAVKPPKPTPDARRRAATFRADIRVMMRPYWLASLAFSLVSNLLLLVSPIYMMQVYDRVMVSGSLDTLFWLSVIAVFLLGIYAVAESGRRRVLSLAGARLEDDLTRRVFRKFDAGGSSGAIDADMAQVGRVAQLFSGNTLSPLFDLPFAPFFVAVLFLVHPLLGWVGLAGTLIVLLVALTAEAVTRGPSEQATGVRAEGGMLTRAMQRQRASVIAMGMGRELGARYDAIHQESEQLGLKTADAEGAFASFAKSLRQILQMSMLGLGATLALSQEISAGAIVAGSIVLARAMGPVDQIIGGWRNLTRGREAWRTLKAELARQPSGAEGYTPLPRPAAALAIDRMASAPSGGDRPLIQPFSLRIEGGALIALVGGIGSGKTTLLHTLAGVLPPCDGAVTLGSADVHAWRHVDRGRYVGFVPQHAEMLPGTVKENIARFASIHDRDVFEALQAAGATDLALSLPNGLDTKVGQGDATLSSGQLQLIGLARALLVKPVLLLLDEPTANLDPLAAGKLVESLKAIARQGCIVIAATHDVRLLQASDGVLAINQGAVSRTSASAYLASQRTGQLRVAALSGERA